MEYTFGDKSSARVNACVLGRALTFLPLKQSLCYFKYFHLEKNSQNNLQYYVFTDQLTLVED